MARTKRIGLISQLYEWCKHNTNVISNQDDFFRIVFQPLCNQEYYSREHPNAMRDLFIYGKPMSEIDNLLQKSELECQQKMEPLIRNLIYRVTDGMAYANALYEALNRLKDEPQQYRNDYREPDMLKLIQYLESMIDKLKTEPNNRDDLLVHGTFNYIYFALSKVLPERLIYEGYQKYQEDLHEYEEKILLSLGCSGKPAIMAIYAMANRKKPNVIALFEAGEIEYYGRNTSGERDFQKAYDYYEKASKLVKDHPLALWSMGYMIYYYGKPEKELKNAYVRQIEKFIERDENTGEIINRKDSYYKAIRYLTKVVHRNGAAENVLARIVADPDVPFEDKRYLKSQEEYLEASAKAGYLFGQNSYASFLLTKISQLSPDDSKFKNKVLEYKRKYRKYIELSAEQGQPWAANHVGVNYLLGRKVKFLNGLYYDLFEEEELSREKAKYFFEKSSQYGGYQEGFWAFYNLICYFDEEDGYSYAERKRVYDKLRLIDNIGLQEKLDIIKEKYEQ